MHLPSNSQAPLPCMDVGQRPKAASAPLSRDLLSESLPASELLWQGDGRQRSPLLTSN